MNDSLVTCTGVVFVGCLWALVIPSCVDSGCVYDPPNILFVHTWCNNNGLCEFDGKTQAKCTATHDPKHPCLALEMPCSTEPRSLVIPLDPIRGYADLPDLYLQAGQKLQVSFDGQPASCDSLAAGGDHNCKTIPGAAKLEIVFLPCNPGGVESYEIRFWDKANPPKVCQE